MANRDRQWWIYALIEPRPDHERFGEPRYVGWTKDPKVRLYTHLYDAKDRSTHKERWLYAVIQAGLKPEMILLESGIGDETWAAAECKWISYYREQGCDLTNATNGGEGLKGFKHSAETRANWSATRKGRTHTDETREKMSATQLRRSIQLVLPLHGTHSQYVIGCRCAACREANRIYKQQLRYSQSSPTYSAETLENMSAAAKHVWRLRPRRRINTEFLRQVVEIYRANFDAAPVKAVARAFGVKRGMAYDYVRHARERGFL